MEISLFLAKAFGLYFVIISLFLIFNYKALLLTISDLTQNRGTLFLAAILTVILGIILILIHNIWIMGWQAIVTLLCWLTFIAGLVRLYFPQFILNKAAKMLPIRSGCIAIGFTCLIIGAFLLYHGFMVSS